MATPPLYSLCDAHLTAGAEPLCAELKSFDGGLGVRFEPVRQLLLVYQQHGGPWDWSKGMRDQELFDEHAPFLDGLVEEGFIFLGGPLDERDVLLVVQGETEASVRSRFVADPWIENAMVTITAVRPWTIFLEGRV
jgi:hypothetical protein